MSDPLADHAVAVWYRPTVGISDAELHDLGSVLSSEEVSRRDRFVFDRDRREFTAAHALLRQALSCCGRREPSEWRFEAAVNGKPRLIAAQSGEPPLAFNLSHTEGLVACVVARGTRVGIDVERLRTRVDPLTIAGRYFAPSEIRLLEAAAPGDRSARFAELWTLKEAYIKAVGLGLSMPLGSFAFDFAGASGLDFTGTEAGAWQFVLAAPSTETRMAIAAENVTGAAPLQMILAGASSLAPGDQFRFLRSSVGHFAGMSPSRPT